MSNILEIQKLLKLEPTPEGSQEIMLEIFNTLFKTSKINFLPYEEKEFGKYTLVNYKGINFRLHYSPNFTKSFVELHLYTDEYTFGPSRKNKKKNRDREVRISLENNDNCFKSIKTAFNTLRKVHLKEIAALAQAQREENEREAKLKSLNSLGNHLMDVYFSSENEKEKDYSKFGVHIQMSNLTESQVKALGKAVAKIDKSRER